MDGGALSDDSDIMSDKKSAIKIDQNNIFNQAGPQMAMQDDDEVEDKLREIEDKINKKGYDLEQPDKNDMFFATEVETNFQKKEDEVVSKPS